MSFGIFMAPFHRLGENPTLALERDLELVEWLDTLGFDEAWIGEHHSAGWEIIASPEIFIAVASQRTRTIKLGTGVVSLPYHNPLMVADRVVLLDHLTRGRAMLGVGPGALPSDAHMLGIDPLTLRDRMDEALGVVIRLFTETEPFTHESDWFTLRDARIQVRPYTQPHMPIAVASTLSPSGMKVAGKYGAMALSLSAFQPGGLINLPNQWTIAEESAARHGKTISRDGWRLLLPMYVAESRAEAFADVREGARRWAIDYFVNTIGRPLEFEGFSVHSDDIVEAMVQNGAGLVGTPDDCIEAIEKLDAVSGGFGGLLMLAHEWAPREKIMRSFELFARYVMPRFQGSLTGVEGSNRWASKNRETLFGQTVAAITKATADYYQT
jgi:limonene 1,2-monooxygenase